MHTPASGSTLQRSAWTHPAARPFVVLGTVAVVGGGLLSAIMAGAPSYHASWAVAYLVLVPGVAQLVLGVAQTSLTDGAVAPRKAALEAISWNLGNAAVLAGTLADIPAVLYVGNALMLAALIMFATEFRHGSRGWALAVAWIVFAVLVISIPIGAVIQAVVH